MSTIFNNSTYEDISIRFKSCTLNLLLPFKNKNTAIADGKVGNYTILCFQICFIIMNVIYLMKVLRETFKCYVISCMKGVLRRANLETPLD